MKTMLAIAFLIFFICVPLVYSYDQSEDYLSTNLKTGEKTYYARGLDGNYVATNLNSGEKTFYSNYQQNVMATNLNTGERTVYNRAGLPSIQESPPAVAEIAPPRHSSRKKRVGLGAGAWSAFEWGKNLGQSDTPYRSPISTRRRTE